MHLSVMVKQGIKQTILKFYYILSQEMSIYVARFALHSFTLLSQTPQSSNSLSHFSRKLSNYSLPNYNHRITYTMTNQW